MITSASFHNSKDRLIFSAFQKLEIKYLFPLLFSLLKLKALIERIGSRSKMLGFWYVLMNWTSSWSSNPGLPWFSSWQIAVTLYPLFVSSLAISQNTFSVPPFAFTTRQISTNTMWGLEETVIWFQCKFVCCYSK